jgi:hypothetical protein
MDSPGPDFMDDSNFHHGKRDIHPATIQLQRCMLQGGAVWTFTRLKLQLLCSWHSCRGASGDVISRLSGDQTNV